MKRILLFAVSMAAFFTLQAQEVLDHAYLECKYTYFCMTDTTGNADEFSEKKAKFHDFIKDDLMVLRIGKRMSDFYSYYSFRADSARADAKARKLDQKSVLDITKQYPKKQTWHLYKNHPAGQLTLTDRILDYYKYEEDYRPQEWEMQEATDSILGYACQLATCRFRGRDYRAWFTMDIPVGEGPWKFNGLPGLILKVEDTAGHYRFEMVGIRQLQDEPIDFSEQKYIKSSRKEYLKLRRKYLMDPVGFINKNSGGRITISTSGKGGNDVLDPMEMTYDFLERDYQ